MLKALYRSIIVAQTARATSQALNFLSDDQLAELGLTRESFVDANVKQVLAQFAAEDASQQYVTVNSNLVGAV